MTSIKFRALTHDDHKLFFEALGEFGKDFQNIQQYMAQKCGKTSKSTDQNRSTDSHEKRDQDKKDDDKKREQIRNFYNKLYAKLSQLIDKLDDRVEKVNQELYLLINYGEIWKKLGFKFNNKTKKLLEELVHQGFTTLRFKNKNVRLRTPPCKALKKINEIGVDEKVKVVTTRELPKDVVVEFHPATNRDWLIVQSMSQNPRVRARLSIQKRLSTLLEFLENKWNVSDDKLSRTVDAWLKVPPNNSTIEDLQEQQPPVNNTLSYDSTPVTVQNPLNTIYNSTIPEQSHSNDRRRLRLRPSAQHELKEVNITRVVPDNHLDLSLNAYISRLGEFTTKRVEPTSRNTSKEASNNHATFLNAPSSESLILLENHEISQGAISSSSRLPISLTTPDSSILLERSVSSDQPLIAQTRRHLNILQSIACSFEGCENSRTAGEDILESTISVASDGPNEPVHIIGSGITVPDPMNQSIDFHIPKNITLGDWFKMNGAGNPLTTTTNEKAELVEEVVKLRSKDIPNNSPMPHNHMIAKLADGWARKDETPITIGEIFLAFKCPDKIVLEYEFEQFIPLGKSNPDNLILKLLTAASLSLAHLIRHKQEQPNARKKRKGPGQIMNIHEIEATNQRVEAALKQLQPTRLSLFRRTR